MNADKNLRLLGSALAFISGTAADTSSVFTYLNLDGKKKIFAGLRHVGELLRDGDNEQAAREADDLQIALLRASEELMIKGVSSMLGEDPEVFREIFRKMEERG